MKLSLC